jgi:hypothetical protein
MVGGIDGGRGVDIQAAAARGIANGTAKLEAAATKMVEAPDVAAAVDMSSASNQVKIAAQVSRVADEMTGTLIDAIA